MSHPPSVGLGSLVGRVVDGRIEILREIGRGGGGAVYEAEHRLLERRVALKLVEGDDGNARARLRNEARAISQIRSPHVVSLVDFGYDDALRMPYLAMEMVEGRPLSELPAPLPWREAAELGVQLLSAIDAAHAAGVHHRDLKPSNVLLLRRQGGGRRLKVLDFGVARLLWLDERMTRTGELVGTPAYMAPEQIQSSEIDGRADLWAAGVILYELVAGRRPFDAIEPIATFRQVLREQPPALEELVPSARPIAAIVRRALSKDPGARYATAEEMGAALRSLLAAPSRPSIATAPATASPSSGSPGAARKIGALAAAAAAAGLIGAVLQTSPTEQQRAPAKQPSMFEAHVAEQVAHSPERWAFHVSFSALLSLNDFSNPDIAHATRETFDRWKDIIPHDAEDPTHVVWDGQRYADGDITLSIVGASFDKHTGVRRFFGRCHLETGVAVDPGSWGYQLGSLIAMRRCASSDVWVGEVTAAGFELRRVPERRPPERLFFDGGRDYLIESSEPIHIPPS